MYDCSLYSSSLHTGVYDTLLTSLPTTGTVLPSRQSLPKDLHHRLHPGSPTPVHLVSSRKDNDTLLSLSESLPSTLPPGDPSPLLQEHWITVRESGCHTVGPRPDPTVLLSPSVPLARRGPPLLVRRLTPGPLPLLDRLPADSVRLVPTEVPLLPPTSTEGVPGLRNPVLLLPPRVTHDGARPTPPGQTSLPRLGSLP